MAFDVITPAQMGRGAITAVTATFYTVGSLTRSILKTIDICNTTISSKRVTVYLVPSGGSASDSTTLIGNVLIPAYGVFQWAGSQVLNTGDTIRAVASSTGCTLNASGAEVI